MVLEIELLKSQTSSVAPSHCILRDTIRGVQSHYPELKSRKELYERLQRIWEVYRNTRLYKGDFKGLQISFNMGRALNSKQEGSEKTLTDFFVDYKKHKNTILYSYASCNPLREEARS